MPVPSLFKMGCDLVQANGLNIQGDPTWTTNNGVNTEYQLTSFVAPTMAGVGSSANMTYLNRPQACVDFHGIQYPMEVLLQDQ